MLKATFMQTLAKHECQYKSKISVAVRHGWLDYQATVKPLKKHLCAVTDALIQFLLLKKIRNDGTEVAISTQRGKSDGLTFRTAVLPVPNGRTIHSIKGSEHEAFGVHFRLL